MLSKQSDRLKRGPRGPGPRARARPLGQARAAGPWPGNFVEEVYMQIAGTWATKLRRSCDDVATKLRCRCDDVATNYDKPFRSVPGRASKRSSPNRSGPDYLAFRSQISVPGHILGGDAVPFRSWHMPVCNLRTRMQIN